MRSSRHTPLDAREFAFAPDAARGRRLDQAVREGLAESLAILFDTLATSFAIDRRRAGALIRRIKAGRVDPGLFGAYVELVMAAFDERLDVLQALADEILETPSATCPSLRTVTLDDAELGPARSDRYRRLLGDDIDMELAPVPASERARAETGLRAALALLSAGAPDAYGEIAALIGQIILVGAGDRPDGVEFGGASTFSLWGAITMNAEALDDRLAGALVLTHEAAYCHLLGLAHGGRLVENEDEERYPSPLRQDSRPMEGVAHAAFVTARVIHALNALLASGALSLAEAASAFEQSARNQAAYDQGLATVPAGARFTPAGAAVFDGLARAMAEPDQAGAR